jgi:hypothetical protein
MSKQSNITPFEQLSLSDNFVFGKVMRQLDICKPFLEELLETPIAKLEVMDEEMKRASSYRGVRLKMEADDAQHSQSIVQLVMVRGVDHEELDLYARYFQCEIDEGYADVDLPNTHMIFVCDYDSYGRGLACYELLSVVQAIEGQNLMPFDNGIHRMELNSCYDRVNVSPAVQEILDYIRTKDDHGQYNTDLAKQVVAAVERIRKEDGAAKAYQDWLLHV